MNWFAICAVVGIVTVAHIAFYLAAASYFSHRMREPRDVSATTGPIPCRYCKHFLNRYAGTKWGYMWYSHECKAHPLPYVPGGCKADYDHCRNYIKDGKCAEFETIGGD